MRSSTLLSVVVPCYNEQDVLPSMLSRLTSVCRGVGTDYEIVLINDGSRDKTWKVMTELAEHDSHLVCLNLSRNYGHQLALSAGLSESCGDVVLVIDADLQDPPELLPDMMEVMRRENADVVYGKRVSRAGETWLKRITSKLYYRGLQWLSDVPIPPDAGDFRLLSRRVVKSLTALPERHRYIRGLVSWLGYKQIAFEYERHARAAGKSNYNFRRMSRLAMDGITSFSTRPLLLPYVFAACALVASFVIFSLALWSWTGGTTPSTGLLAALILFLSSAMFLNLGLLGEYIGRMQTEVRGRPLFVIDQVVRNSHCVTLPIREAA